MSQVNPKAVSNWPDFISCGILKKEIRLLAETNNWPVKMRFLDSSLHIYLDRLETQLTRELAKDNTQKKIVIYGTCHPKMDEFIAGQNAVRTGGQNCVELLLGKKRFTKELSAGAFFLFEDWAKRWNQFGDTFFGDPELTREVFQEAHSYLLAIRTPCSGDFSQSALDVSTSLGLPLVWEDFDLSHLEQHLQSCISLTVSS